MHQDMGFFGQKLTNWLGCHVGIDDWIAIIDAKLCVIYHNYKLRDRCPPYRFGVRLWPGDYDNKRLKLRQNWLKFDQFFNRLDKYKYRTTKILKL